MKTWKYVALGDSFPAGFGVGEQNYVNFLAGYLQQDFGAQVLVENFAQSGATTAGLLYLLRSVEEVRKAVKEADMVTLWIGWNDMTYSLSLFDYQACGGEDNLDCIRSAAQVLNANMDAILDEIWGLTTQTGGKVLIADNLIPEALMDMWLNYGNFAGIKDIAFESWRAHLIRTAKQRGFDLVQTCEKFNGPNGDTLVAGVMQGDGFHLNQKGHEVLADLHREALKEAM